MDITIARVVKLPLPVTAGLRPILYEPRRRRKYEFPNFINGNGN